MTARQGIFLSMLAGLLTIAGVVVDATPAAASCAGSPRVSAHRFMGTVTAVSNVGRTATVKTDDGRTVTVLGSTATGPNAATTVDRAYTVGQRYEFHPTNAGDPYLDNACTATHPIGGSPAAASPAAASPAAASAGSTTALRVGLVVAIALAAVLAALGLWFVRRRRRPTTGHVSS